MGHLGMNRVSSTAAANATCREERGAATGPGRATRAAPRCTVCARLLITCCCAKAILWSSDVQAQVAYFDG
jgi:hypothetical protein